MQKTLTFIDWFAGIGGFRIGLEDAGCKCVGFCEKDDNALASYITMHIYNQHQINYLCQTTRYKERKEMVLQQTHTITEWFAKDVCDVNANTIPPVDIWTFGAPCQDFSLSNAKRQGLNGDKSRLVKEIFRLLQEIPWSNKPEWLIYENVEGMLSSNKGFDFLAILNKMVELGYDCEWQLLNTKHFRIPQNRRRIFLIGHLRKCGRRNILPITSIFEQSNNRTETNKRIKVRAITETGYNFAYVGDTINFIQPKSKTRRGRIGLQIANTLDTHMEQYVITNISNAPKTKFDLPYLIDNVLYYITIRRLTPRECFRLQGFTDIYYERAKLVNGNVALYKQIGNSVTTNIVREIGLRIMNTYKEQDNVE